MTLQCPIQVSDPASCMVVVVHGSALEYVMNGTLTSVNDSLRYSLPLFLFESAVFGMATVAISLLLYACIRWQCWMKAGTYRSACIFCVYVALSVHWGFSLRYNSKISDALLWGPNESGNSGDTPVDFNTGFVNLGYTDGFAKITCEATLFGVLGTLFSIVLSLFLECKFERKNYSQQVPFILVSIMFLASLGHLILSVEAWIPPFLQTDQYMGNWATWDNALSPRLSLSISALYAIAILCGDATVLWRASVVWMHRRCVKYSAAFILSMTFGFTVWDLILLTKAVEFLDGLQSSSLGSQNVFASTPGKGVITLSFLSNVLATCSISWQAWIHRRQLRTHFISGSQRFLTEKVLAVFIESGVIYTLFWAVYVYASIASSRASPATSNDTTVESLLVYTSSAIVQIVAIYPTAIITLVIPLPSSISALRQHHDERLKLAWQQTWAVSPRYNKLRRVFDTVPSARFLTGSKHLSRAANSVLFQLRSRHIGLNQHLHRIGAVESPLCPNCLDGDETIEHYIYECEEYRVARTKLRAKTGRAFHSLPFLLTDHAGLRHLIDYLHETARFNIPRPLTEEDERAAERQHQVKTILGIKL